MSLASAAHGGHEVGRLHRDDGTRHPVLRHAKQLPVCTRPFSVNLFGAAPSPCRMLATNASATSPSPEQMVSAPACVNASKVSQVFHAGEDSDLSVQVACGADDFGAVLHTG